MQEKPFSVRNQRCDALRWKGMFIDTEEESSPEKADGSNFWCVYTQNCLGPDGEVAGEDTCTASRSCYDPV
jgi:hypothetical protein